MQKNDLLRLDDEIIRILEIQDESIFVIPCVKKSMPYWMKRQEVASATACSEDYLLEITDVILPDMEVLSAKSKCFVYKHFTLIAGILPYVSDEKKRKYMINQMAEEMKVSKQTIRYYLCQYLVYQDIRAFAPKERINNRKLTADEKNIRWALNKYYFNRKKNSLNTAYTMMLKEKYCNAEGRLVEEFPTIHQFKYFYHKHKRMQTYYISRDGLSNYQRNHRPLTGDGVQEYASNVGVGMLDATVCDIYLINESGSLIGRPILTACIDAYSGLCCGYSLTLEGGTYSLRNLMLNIITDKAEWCRSLDINIQKEDWDCQHMPGVLVTDMGAEYNSDTFSQITELGVKIVNLPPYRPDLKGPVEKFFDMIQGMYKQHLKGKGVIEPDFQERGVHDYRRDACLTLKEFEKILVRCILYYNNKRIIEDFPYSKEMLEADVKPYSREIWKWGRMQNSVNLIPLNKRELIFTLLPRTKGKFSRNGLRVNRMRYYQDGFTEQYLQGSMATVAYNPEDVSSVWLVQDGEFVQFELIQSRYKNQSLESVEQMRKNLKQLIKEEQKESIQARIDLVGQINVIAEQTYSRADVKIKDIRSTRRREQEKYHKDYLKEGANDD